MEIKIQNVSMTYPSGKQALKGLNLDLKSPSLIGLLGPNGAGKSTLMKLLVAGLLPTGGAIRADGEPLTKCERAYKARLGYLPQDFGLFDELTVEQFLDYMGALKGLPKAQARRRAKELLELVGLSQAAKGKIKTYSGGMKQRLGIAQALLNRPKLLILDEPTAGLDPKERVRFRELIAELGADSIVLLSTHIISDVEQIAGRILMVRDGQLIFDGGPGEIRKDLERFYLDQFEGGER